MDCHSIVFAFLLLPVMHCPLSQPEISFPASIIIQDEFNDAHPKNLLSILMRFPFLISQFD